MATTPGKVIIRNDLMELIQYSPATQTGVQAAAADRAALDQTKYYILDLNPDKSFVRYAVEQGHTVFHELKLLNISCCLL